MSTLENVKNIVKRVNVVWDIFRISPKDIGKKEEKKKNKEKNNEGGDTTNGGTTNEQKNGSCYMKNDQKKTEEGDLLEFDIKMKTKFYNSLCNYFDKKKNIFLKMIRKIKKLQKNGIRVIPCIK
ncbi:hypothetical protein PFLG_03013 [Plasmodium falciparum RAJ116]|uniref:Uncharacterized protein n=1 Tax=Plasmodium falciparum RAJ116 TaxID=580058 RepID=A0A0L0D0J3_PLAFA|nr:hypothetical protein PFLG_03013 [Plasmodium falciparum RAJ116]